MNQPSVHTQPLKPLTKKGIKRMIPQMTTYIQPKVRILLGAGYITHSELGNEVTRTSDKKSICRSISSSTALDFSITNLCLT